MLSLSCITVFVTLLTKILLSLALRSRSSAAGSSNCWWYAQAGNESSYYVSSAFTFDGNAFIPAVYSNLSSGSTLSDSASLTNDSRGIDITLITQLSDSRSYIMEPMAQHWAGPIVFVVFFNEQPSSVENLKPLVADRPALASRRNIIYRIVFDKRQTLAIPGLYPTNVLRNVALRTVQTSHTLHLDADFLPNAGMYDSLLRQLRTLEQHETYIDDDEQQKIAFVIPAFEYATKG